MNSKQFTHFRNPRGRRVVRTFGPFFLVLSLMLFLFAAGAEAQCTYTISPTNQGFSSLGGTDTVTVTTQDGCNWTATTSFGWIGITSGSSGSGSGTVTYSVSTNGTGQPDTGTMTIAGQEFTVRQAQAVFSDVADPAYWAYGSIYSIYAEGITSGFGGTTFYRPELTVTREQMAAFIIRTLEGEPPDNYCAGGSPFTDVAANGWACKHIKRLRDLGLTTGYGGNPTIFEPALTVPRDQMAAFIIRALEGEPAVNYCDSGSPFTDVAASGWACKYIKRLRDLGLTTGYGGNPTIYRPELMVSRDQMAAFLHRAFLGGGGDGTNEATITIISHFNGQQVEDRTITLTGFVQSGSVPVTKVMVVVGSTSVEATVDPASGVFSVGLPLNVGINHLQFATQGLDASSNLIVVPNNTFTQDFAFAIEFTGETAIMLVTLTWDKDDTDVDLYVIDPTGDFSAYYHRATASGGVLDHDVTGGFGPEHWTLGFGSIIQYGSPYQVRLHYYSDHGNGPTNYQVTITLYEGTVNEQTYSYNGTLSVSDGANDAPDGAGADWVDLPGFTLTPSVAGARATIASQGHGDPSGAFRVRATIPPAAERMRMKRR